MYFTLFSTTLVFALAALSVRADFNVATINLTQVSDSLQDPPFSVLGRSFCLVCDAVSTRDP